MSQANSEWCVMIFGLLLWGFAAILEDCPLAVGGAILALMGNAGLIEKYRGGEQ